MKHLLGRALATAVAILPLAATAATSTGNLNVTAQVADTCQVTTTGVSFSVLNVLAVTDEATPGVVTLQCSSSKTGVSVTLSGGQNASGGQRRMSDGAGNFVPYDIFGNAARSAALLTDGTVFSGLLSAATPTPIAIYGRVPAGNYAAGNYSDQILVTLSY